MKLIKRFLNHQNKELNTIFKKKVKEELIRNHPIIRNYLLSKFKNKNFFK